MDAKKISEVLVDQYDIYGPLEANGWLHGFATADDEFARGVLECQLKYEPTLRDTCRWRNRMVLGRTGEQEGEVLYFGLELTKGAEQANCVKWAECYRSLWEGRRGPYPATAQDRLAVRLGGNPFFADGTSGEEYLAWYENRMKKLEEIIQNMKAAIAVAGPDNPIVRHNITRAESELEHIRRLLEIARNKQDP